ncbi:MAG: carbohydrate ABC transporter permease [Acidimicrobiia bacterium]|nr:carbohydrate ABC transporter permease [Acidimicrobiia bacterium]
MTGLAVGVRKKNWFRGRSWPVHGALILTTFLIGFPLAYAALIATQSNPDVFAFKLTPGDSLAQNFQDVWFGRNLGRYMWNSTVQSVLITVAKTILSLAAGLAFVYFRFKAKWIVFFFVLITLMMPTEVMILALFRLVSAFDWKDTMAALVVPFAASATGAFLFRQHFANLPNDLAEASQVDGASPLQFLTKVLIPLSWNTIGALAVIQFVYGWNMYLWPVLIISKQEAQVIQVGLQNLQGIDVGLTYGPLMLAALLASIPPTIVFILLQKPFMSGFSITADK